MHVDHLAPTLAKVVNIIGWDKTPGLTINEKGGPA